VYNGRASHKRKPYKSNLDSRGKTGKEMKVMASFWRQHSMDDIITKTPEEIDQLLDAWFLQYEATQQIRHKTWWYPETVR
jgi:hypothetical protein